MSSKILIVGSIDENLTSALLKISQINLKHGPFEMVLTCGDLISHDFDLLNLPKLPIPLYFIRGKNQIRDDIQEMISGNNGVLGENIIFLGDSGVYKSATGLLIAYVGGGLSSFNTKVFEKSVDFLVTFDYPFGVEGSSAVLKGSKIISEICSMCQPRYHFSSNDVFYERLPYKNIKDPSITTRFIALPKYEKKHKWFYAINYSNEKRVEKATPNPFVETGVVSQKRSADGFFYPDEQKVVVKKQKTGPCKICKRSNGCEHTSKREIPEGYICRICGIPGHHIKDCDQGFTAGRKNSKRDFGKCWFCLSNPDVESHLIATVVQDTYIAIAKGGLVKNHALIVPVIHYASSRQLERFKGEDIKLATAVFNEIDKVEKEFSKLQGKNGNIVVHFELFGGGDQTDYRVRLHHMHIQLVPIDENLEDTIMQLFIEEAKNEGLEVSDKLPEDPFWPFCKFGVVGGNFVVVSPPLPINGITVPFNLQIARYVLANAIGKPDLVDWKKCIVDYPTESAYADNLRSNLPYN